MDSLKQANKVLKDYSIPKKLILNSCSLVSGYSLFYIIREKRINAF